MPHPQESVFVGVQQQCEGPAKADRTPQRVAETAPLPSIAGIRLRYKWIGRSPFSPNLRLLDFADAALRTTRELPFHFAGRRLKQIAKAVEGALQYN